MIGDHERIIQIIQNFLDGYLKYYDVHEKSIIFFTEPNNKVLAQYHLDSEKLWYDHSLADLVNKYFSHFYSQRFFIEALRRLFLSYFRDFKIRSIEGANIVT